MKLAQFETTLYAQLSEFFQDRGFVLLAEKKQFRRPFADGFQNVIFSVSYHEREYWLDVNLGIRFDMIEEIAQQFLENLPAYRRETNTVIISIGKLCDNQYFRYKIVTPQDLDDACQEIQQFMENRGFLFFEEATGLYPLNRLLNGDPDKNCRFLYNQTDRCFKALIAAKLTFQPHWLSLAKTYRHYLERQNSKASTLHNFDRIMAFLVHYSPN